MDESLVIFSRDQVLRRICGEYLEMPGLRLTPAQARRLWGLDEPTCTQLLTSLTESKFLYRRQDGMYARLSDGPPVFPVPRMIKADPEAATSARPAVSSTLKQ
jgi:hypothetical protein